MPPPGCRCSEGSGGFLQEGNLAESVEWLRFLQEANLAEYADLLQRHGFDDMDTLAEIEGADLKDLRIPSCDAARLLERLEHFRRERLGTGEDHPVRAFLGSIGLSQYADLLLENGFDDMDTLQLIRESDMWHLGVLRGHGLKLAKHLRELSSAAPQAAPGQPECSFPAAAPKRPSPPASPCTMVPRCTRPAPIGAPLPALDQSARCLVEKSWEDVQKLGCMAVGDRLCVNTLRLAPGVQHLFTSQVRYAYSEHRAAELVGKGSEREAPALRKHFGKVIEVVGMTVAGPHEPSRNLPMLWNLGARHAGLGIREGHWKVLGQAISATLKECLGDKFTPEVQLAWTLAYSFISAVMMEGVKGASKTSSSSSSNGRPSSETGSYSTPPSSSTTRSPSAPSSCDETAGLR